MTKTKTRLNRKLFVTYYFNVANGKRYKLMILMQACFYNMYAFFCK